MITSFEYRGSDDWPLFATRIVRDNVADADGRLLVLLHGGGPDHESLIPLGKELADLCTVVLPDVRGYGRSVCRDPARHTWAQYALDVVALLDYLGGRNAIIGGAGLGSTITLRAMLAHRDRVRAAILISVEDIEDDERKTAEITFMDAFAARVRDEGLEAAWAPILPDLAPVIGAMVRDAIPRSDPASVAAAAAVGRDRSFQSVNELAGIPVPTLILPGMDARHPLAIAHDLARVLPFATIAAVAMSADLADAESFGQMFAPAIHEFVEGLDRDGENVASHNGERRDIS